MGLGQNAVKWLMFIFNFIFFIIGIALISAGAVAQTHYKAWSHFVANGTISAPALVIVVGVFVALVSFLGCCGAAREHYYMLMAFAILVSIIFVVQFSAGIAGYVQRGKISGWVKQGLDTSINEYRSGKDVETVNSLQETLYCCGNAGFQDWLNGAAPNANLSMVPESCCKVEFRQAKTCGTKLNATSPATCSSTLPYDDSCPIYVKGCGKEVSNVLRYAMASVAGAAVGLSVIELIGIVFACFLARRIRSGYTYA